MDKNSAIFKPIQLGPVKVKNRIEVAPAATFMADHDGSFSTAYREYVKNLAKSGAGIVNTGVTDCNQSPPMSPLGFGTLSASSLYGADLDDFSEICHMYGAKASLELVYIQYMLAPPHVTASVSTDEVKKIISDFATAAAIGAKSGFDIICIHGGHGNVPSVFFSAKHNQRTDEYGGSFENRCRFGMELLDAVRVAIGPKKAISYRISAEEMLDGWTTLDETIEYAKVIQDKIDLLHVSRGLLESHELLPYLNAPPYFPRAINLPFAKKFKEVLHVPVTVVNAFNLELAEEAVSNGDVDMVSMVRTVLADTDCVEKARRGKIDEVRPCVRCNTCINRCHTKFIHVRCAVNPILGRETQFPPIRKSDVSKKIVIVGGGPAGLEAARTAAKLGHSVILFEKTGVLGGALHYAASAEFKHDMRKYMDWSVRMVQKDPNIEIRLNDEATPEKIAALASDNVIVAIGCKPIIPAFTATNTPKLQWVGDVEMDAAICGESVIIVGAGYTGLEAALSLALKGKKVKVIDMLPEEMIGIDGIEISMIGLREELTKAGVEIECNLKLVDVTEAGAIVESTLDKAQKILDADTIVLSLGVRPDEEEVRAFDDCAEQVFYIGDCTVNGGTLFTAVHSGFNIVMNNFV